MLSIKYMHLRASVADYPLHHCFCRWVSGWVPFLTTWGTFLDISSPVTLTPSWCQHTQQLWMPRSNSCRGKIYLCSIYFAGILKSSLWGPVSYIVLDESLLQHTQIMRSLARLWRTWLHWGCNSAIWLKRVEPGTHLKVAGQQPSRPHFEDPYYSVLKFLWIGLLINDRILSYKVIL